MSYSERGKVWSVTDGKEYITLKKVMKIIDFDDV